jgi:hypothetical protein
MRALILILLVACGGTTPRTVTPKTDGDFAPAIRDEATWHALAATAGNEVMAHVEVVKVLLDHQDERLYFMQSRRWPIHFDFAERFLSSPGAPVLDQRRFNDLEYHDDHRRFVLGTVTHYLDQDTWTFELFAGDLLSIEATQTVFDAIRKATYFGDRLRYRPIPEKQLAVLERVRAALPVTTTEELFANVRYEPLEPGDAWGYLRIVPAGAAPPENLRPYEIVVLGTQPLELPPVAGIVTDELQAPLGHIAVLAHSRATPNMALRAATSDPAFVALAGRAVHLHVGPGTFTLEPATPDDLARAARARHAKAPALKLDTRDLRMPRLRDIETGDLAKFGAKTTQLARVARIGGIRTPRAFGLSFHAYAEFLATTGIDRQIAALLADSSVRQDEARLRAGLDAIRAAIAAAPVPPTITDPLVTRMRAELGGSALVRLRSSTNAEDLAGFSGAGLYRSARVDPTSRDDVERGLREVWASVWSWEAFAEREWYGIDHTRVAMAILVQESIDDEVVIGVAITGNPFYEGRPAVYINAQARGGSVTGAAGNEIPEQLLVYTWTRTRDIERISASSRVPGQQLLRDADAVAFARQLEAIHNEFVGDPVGTAAAVDVEFLVRANRELVVLQARPYKLHWSEDRVRGGD